MMHEIAFPRLGLSFSLDPIAIHFPALGGGIYWYGILMASGILLAALYCMHLMKREGESPELILDLLLYALPISIVCARLYYVIFSWDRYKDHLIDIVKIWEGGIAIYGAVIGAVVTAYLFFRHRGRNVAHCFDICCFGLLIGQIIGRWGNFVNGEAYGTATDSLLGMTIGTIGPVHPTFLYESLWNLVGFVLLSIWFRRKHPSGAIFCGYLAWYGAGRVWIEGLRTDSLYLFGSLRISQLVAALCIVGGLAGIAVLRRKEKNVTEL